MPYYNSWVPVLELHPLNDSVELSLPTLIMCNQIPTTREEISTPAAVSHHSHLSGIADHIPALDRNANILLLLGRNLPRVHLPTNQ